MNKVIEDLQIYNNDLRIWFTYHKDELMNIM